MCNLTEINGSDITTQEEFNRRVKVAATIATFQAGYTDFHYLRESWKETIEEDSLIGIGITGIANENLLKLDFTEAVNGGIITNGVIADSIDIKPAKRVSCVKPSGTSSIVLKTSSGVHAWHDEYFIRRMRINKDEPIYDYINNTLPDLMEDEFFSPSTTSVLSIPIKAPDGAITRHESTLDLLERIKKINLEWVQTGTVIGNEFNNVSATVSVKDGEWDMIMEWMWVNRNSYAGISLLPEDGGTYKQMPFESIDKVEFERLLEFVNDIDLSKVYESDDNTDLSGEVACGGGACEIKGI